MRIIAIHDQAAMMRHVKTGSKPKSGLFPIQVAAAYRTAMDTGQLSGWQARYFLVKDERLVT